MLTWQISFFISFQPSQKTPGSSWRQGCTYLKTNYWYNNQNNRGFTTKGENDCNENNKAICQLT